MVIIYSNIWRFVVYLYFISNTKILIFLTVITHNLNIVWLG